MQCLWFEYDNTRLFTLFVRFIEGVELFNFEILSKTPNMMFFSVFIAFSVGITTKHEKRNIFTLLYTFYITQSIYLKETQKVPMFIVGK